MSPGEARERIAASRVARLATVGATGAPHLVPICFAVAGDTIYTAVDAKPKRSASLQRLRNIAADGAVAVLADEYDDEDWARLWWARADGRGRVLDPGDAEAVRAAALLRERYRQYRTMALDGPVVAIDVRRWSGWSASPPPAR